MNYEEVAQRTNPFAGLTLSETKRLMIYFNYVAQPTIGQDEVARRWHVVIPAEEQCPVFEAMEIADEIRNEIAQSRMSKDAPYRTEATQVQQRSAAFTLSRENKKIFFFLVVLTLVLVVLTLVICGVIWNSRRLEEKERRQKEFERIRAAQEIVERKEKAERSIPEIDQLLATDPSEAFKRYSQESKYSETAKCRENFCLAYHIGYKPHRLFTIHGCPVAGDCIERVSRSRELMRSLAKVQGLEVTSLKRLRNDTKDKVAFKELNVVWLKELADSNDVESVLELANQYLTGEMVKQDRSLAKQYFAKYISLAPPQDVAWPLLKFDEGEVFKSGDLLEMAKSLEKHDMSKAVKLYEVAAGWGAVEACEWLGKYWFEGVPNDPYGSRRHGKQTRFGDYDYDKAGKHAYYESVKWFTAATKLKCGSDVYLYLSQLRTHDSERIKDYRNAARMGNVEASLKLGRIYRDGSMGVVANKAEAKKHFLNAAQQGNADAQLEYAFLLEQPTDAWSWVLKSAQQGNVEAQYQCGRISDFWGWGASARRNWREWRRAIDTSNRYLLDISPVNRDEETFKSQAIYWYRKAAKNGHKGAEQALSSHNATLE